MKNLFRFCLLLALLALFGCGDNDTLNISRTWEPAVEISGDQVAYNAQAVMDDQGNALVAWFAGNNLFAKKYSSSGGWDSVATRFDNAVLRAVAFKIAMNRNGEGVAAWRVEESTGDFFYARKFSVATGWDIDFQRLCDNANDGQIPDAAITASGLILTVFSKYNVNEVSSRGFEPGIGWDSSPAVIESSTFNTNYPQVALDSAGNGVAVWERYDGTFTNAYARRYTTGVGWDGPVVMLDDPLVSGHVNRTHISLNEQGSGVAFWDQQDGSSYGIYARTFHSGPLPGWSTEIVPVVISSDFIANVNGVIAADGKIIITWTVRDGVRTKLFARAYTPASGWDASITTVSDPLLDLDVKAAFFAVDRDGNGLAVWSQDNEINPTVYAREYKAGAGWGAKIQTVYQYPAGFGGTVSSLSMSPSGKVLVVLTSYDLPAESTSRIIAILSR